ncbi:MAG TPA: hypothetical protein VM074_04465 [Solimonas sp.]|nr:hypothetical protein [Solimonas sp.]
MRTLTTLAAALLLSATAARADGPGAEEPAATPAQPATEATPDAPAAPATGGMLRRPGRDQQPAAQPVAGPDPRSPAQEPPKMSPGLRQVDLDKTGFRPDPDYSSQRYDAAAQHDVYGAKRAVRSVRPLLELGYPLYAGGEFGTGHNLLGAKNLVRPQFLVYGDWRTAVAWNDIDVPDVNGDTARGLFATRLNLDLDLKLTATERIHVLMRPLDKNGKFTRYQFEGVAADGEPEREAELNGRAVTAFFEGDLGQMAQGFSGHYNGVDLPVAAGVIPLLFQNGIWLDDAFTGLAFTIPARNSPALDISNMDFTFFAAFDKVSSPVLRGSVHEDHRADLYGTAWFIEMLRGYIEADYGYLDDHAPPGADDLGYHSASLAFTRRYGGWLSNSVRVLGAFGQSAPATGDRTANGVALLLENSLITSLPSTLVPYFNLFFSNGTPQSLARDPGAGGFLKNTGLNFETDGLTGFPKLDDSGADAYGGAVGIEYLFGLDQQLVFEIAGLQHTDGPLEDSQDYAAGLRWQLPFLRQWIVRADAMAGRSGSGSTAARDLAGVRMELRVKF